MKISTDATSAERKKMRIAAIQNSSYIKQTMTIYLLFLFLILKNGLNIIILPPLRQ